MIHLHVDAVIIVRDGFTGRAVTPSAVRVTLDGLPFRPEYREGGYLVFVNLESGKHELIFSATFYRDETLSFETRGPRVERVVCLKPASNYTFGAEVARLDATITEGGKPSAFSSLLLADASYMEIKIAQDSVSAGETEIKLYVRRGQELQILPGEYLIADGKKSETVTLFGYDEGVGRLAVPLKNEHKRGAALCPCQSYITDESGTVTAYFKQPGLVYALTNEKSSLISLELKAGVNEVSLDG